MDGFVALLNRAMPWIVAIVIGLAVIGFAYVFRAVF